MTSIGQSTAPECQSESSSSTVRFGRAVRESAWNLIVRSDTRGTAYVDTRCLGQRFRRPTSRPNRAIALATDVALDRRAGRWRVFDELERAGRSSSTTGTHTPWPRSRRCQSLRRLRSHKGFARRESPRVAGIPRHRTAPRGLATARRANRSRGSVPRIQPQPEARRQLSHRVDQQRVFFTAADGPRRAITGTGRGQTGVVDRPRDKWRGLGRRVAARGFFGVVSVLRDEISPTPETSRHGVGSL